MIGLKRGVVRLVPHHKQWERAFDREKRKILKKLGDFIIDIEHIGSTAIPKISSKPIIDMSAGVRNLKDAKKFIKPLSTIGYKFYRSFGDQILFARGPDEKRTHYLHVMKYNGIKWKNDLLFRIFLSDHPVRARAYAVLKKKLAKQYPNNRDKYTSGKREFIEKTIQIAKRNRKFK